MNGKVHLASKSSLLMLVMASSMVALSLSGDVLVLLNSRHDKLHCSFHTINTIGEYLVHRSTISQATSKYNTVPSSQVCLDFLELCHIKRREGCGIPASADKTST